MYGGGDREYLRRSEAIFHPIKHRIGGSVHRGDPGSKRKPQLFIHMADDLACMLFKVLNISPSHAKMLRMVCLTYEHELSPLRRRSRKKEFGLEKPVLLEAKKSNDCLVLHGVLNDPLRICVIMVTLYWHC